MAHDRTHRHRPDWSADAQDALGPVGAVELTDDELDAVAGGTVPTPLTFVIYCLTFTAPPPPPGPVIA